MLPANNVIKEFHLRNGGECYSDGSFHYYENGAMRDVHPLGILMDPPEPRTAEDEWKLESNKLQFARLKLSVAVNEFEQRNEWLRYRLPDDQEAALADLKRLQLAIEERKTFVAAAEERLKNTRWGKAKQARERREQEERQRFHDFQNQRRAIRI